MEIKDRKFVRDCLDEISSKMIVIYGVYVGESKRAKHKERLDIALAEQKESEEIINQLTLRTIAHNKIENEKMLPMVQKLNKNFKWAFNEYELCVLLTGVQPYIKSVEQEKTKFDGYFNSLTKIALKEDAKTQESKKKETTPLFRKFS